MEFAKIETTASTTSVGADDRQSDLDYIGNITQTTIDGKKDSDDWESMVARLKEMNSPGYLPCITMQELYQTVYDGREEIVADLLHSGVYILAGAPKIGKSFLVAQIAYHVSVGVPLWEHTVHQGAVLYLALEDDYKRLQTRLYRMVGPNDTPNLYIAIDAKQLGVGLEQQLESFVIKHPDTKLIIIDTLQRVRANETDGYSYANDYEVIGRAKELAYKYAICIIIVHHTRKQAATDNFDLISGTTGLLGCADGAFLMQKENRTDLTAILDVVGRDQRDQRLHLKKDMATLVWELERTETELWKAPPDPVLDAISNFLRDTQKWMGSPTELSELLGLEIGPIALTKHLNVNAGRLAEEHQILYMHKTMHEGRRIVLQHSDIS